MMKYLVIVLLVFSYASSAVYVCQKEDDALFKVMNMAMNESDKTFDISKTGDLKKAGAAWDKAVEVRDTATEAFEKAEAALDNADAVADQTFADYKMAAEVYQELKTHDNISMADYKELITDWKQKEAAYNEADAALERAMEDYDKADAALKKAHTDYDKAKVAYRNIFTGGDAHLLSLFAEADKLEIEHNNCRKKYNLDPYSLFR